MIGNAERVVFDCPVFAQALINVRGPAAECLRLAQGGRLTLFVSDYVLQEIRELPSKLKVRLGITAERVEGLIQDLGKYAIAITDIPVIYTHPVDPDDSPYVNLALAAKARLIVTRDTHLLKLMHPTRVEGVEFRRRCPDLEIVMPEIVLRGVQFPSA